MNEIILNWLSAYLDQRKQRVVIDLVSALAYFPSKLDYLKDLSWASIVYRAHGRHSNKHNIYNYDDTALY